MFRKVVVSRGAEIYTHFRGTSCHHPIAWFILDFFQRLVSCSKSLSAKSPLFAWLHSFEILDFYQANLFSFKPRVWQVIIWLLFLLPLSFFTHIICIHVTYIIFFFLPVEDMFLHYLKCWPVECHSHRQKCEWHPMGCVRRWLCSRGPFNQQLSWFSSVWSFDPFK